MPKRKRTTSDAQAAQLKSRTATELESLSNELILDIFEYLDAYDLCQAFYGLNHRFNTLLQLVQLYILQHASKANETIWDTLISFIKPSQIRILSSQDGTMIDKRILSAALNNNLQTMSLHEMTKEQIHEICQHLPDGNQIKCVSLKEELSYPLNLNGETILDLLLVDYGHRFHTLAYLSISCNWAQFPPVTVTFPELHYLSIENCYFTTNLLQFIQINTPNLRSFKFAGTFEPWMPSSITLNHIHELHINVPSDLSFVQALLAKFPSLRRLHIDWQSNRRIPVIDGNQWQKLIEQYLPHLKQLTIYFQRGADEDILQTFYQGEFWSTKKVKATMGVDKAQSRYRSVKTISFGKEWHFAYFDNFVLK